MRNLLLLINSILLGVLCIVSFIQDSFFEKIRIIFIIVCILQSVLSILVLMKLKKEIGAKLWKTNGILFYL